MTDQLRPANLETAFGNARALSLEIEVEKIYPAFDVAMDMARLLDGILQSSPVRSQPD